MTNITVLLNMSAILCVANGEDLRYQDLVNAPTVYRVKVGKDVIFTCSEMLEKDTGVLVGRHHQRAEDGRVVSGSRTKADGRSASVGVVFCS